MRFSVIRHDNVAVMAILKEQFRKMGSKISLLETGEIEIADDISEDELAKVVVSLRKYSIEILDDDKGRLVERIRSVLMELVYDTKPQPMTISYHLSERLNLSYGYLSFVFASQTHYSIEKYIILLRIERAKEMILENRLTLKQISGVLNYSSVQHFSRQFKKTTGLTISSFRRVIEKKKANNQ